MLGQIAQKHWVVAEVEGLQSCAPNLHRTPLSRAHFTHACTKRCTCTHMHAQTYVLHKACAMFIDSDCSTDVHTLDLASVRTHL